LFEEYLRLSRIDAKAMTDAGRVGVSCQGCGGEDAVPHLEKNGFPFLLCPDCGTLFCSPRPNEASLEKLYADSPSARFWARRFFPAVAEARRERLFRPKAQRVAALLKETALDFTPKTICDVGAGYGIFLEELAPHFPQASLCAVEPGENLACTCLEKGFETLCVPVENAEQWAGRFDLLLCSEVIEHVFDTAEFLSGLGTLLRPGGYCLLTGLGYEGFDILTLQERSNSIFPPHHLNFLSVGGFQRLFERCGFERAHVTTPGQLDVDIVLNSGIDSEFLRVLSSRGPEAVADLQALLQKHKLSSHVWVLAQKNLSSLV
jgi:SAM-dependent methyltransferase